MGILCLYFNGFPFGNGNVWDRNEAQTICGFGFFMIMACPGVCNVIMMVGEFSV